MKNWEETPTRLVLFLPPTNEVCGKIMFLHLSVILFTGGHRVCIQWGSASRGGGLHPGGLHPKGSLHPGEVCILVGSASRGAWAYAPSTMRYDQQAGGTHHTGMYSCYILMTTLGICT